MALVDVADLTATTTAQAAVDVAGVSASTSSSPSTTAVVDAADMSGFTVADVATFDGTTWVMTHSGTFSTTTAPALVESGAPSSSGVTRTIAFQAAPTLTLTGTLVTPTSGGGITVTLAPDRTPPTALIGVSGMSGQTVTVTRQNLLTGEIDTVRNADTVPLSAGGLTVADVEAPFGTPVTYTATTNTGVFNTSDAATLVVPDAWLIHPALPDVSLPIVVQSRSDRSRPANVGVFKVLGRSRPLIRSDGVRQDPEFSLVVYTVDAIAAQSLLELIGDGSALLLQIPVDNFYDWVGVGDVTEADLGTEWAPDRLWTLPCTVVDRPVVATSSLRTLADVSAEFGSLLEIRNNYATLADIASDNLIGA